MSPAWSFGPSSRPSCVTPCRAFAELRLTRSPLQNYRYDFKLVDGPEKWEVVEGFLRKPSGLRLGLKRRENQTYV